MESQTDPATRSDGDETASSRADAGAHDPLTTLFGTHAKVKLIAALYDSYEPIDVPELVDRADLDSRTSWYRQKDDLLASGIVERVEKVGNSPKYALAGDGDAVEALGMLRDYVNSNRLEAREESERDEE